MKTAAFDAMPFRAAVIDADGVILTVNELWRNYAEEDGALISGLRIGQNYLDRYDRAGEAGSSKAIEAAAGIRCVLLRELREFVLEDPCYSVGPQQSFRVTATPIKILGSNGAIIMHGDMALQKEFESDLLKREAQHLRLFESTLADSTSGKRIETVRRLAGGAAHDFRNILAVISGYSQLLEERLAADEDGRRYAHQISLAVDRAAAFTRQLLNLNRKESLGPVSLDLNAEVVSHEKVLRQMMGKEVTLTVILAPELPTIKADPGQIEQILLNLIANARDAMPQGGEMVIQTSGADADGHIMLSVSDNGCGMDQPTQDRIFDPFFTTKDPDKGTGLGLSTVEEIVKQNRGHILVQSEPMVGTRFQIYLPVAASVPGPILLAQQPLKERRGVRARSSQLRGANL